MSDPNERQLIFRKDEPWRRNRLIAVWYIAEAAGILGLDLSIDINSLEDHKGNLTVLWNRIPRREEAETFSMAWDVLNEPRENVEHKMICSARIDEAVREPERDAFVP